LLNEDENGILCGDGRFYTLKTGLTDGITEGAVGRENTRREIFFSRKIDFPTKDTNLYDAWLRNGDVFATFFGHAHVNDFAGITDDGIAFCSTASAGGFNIEARYRDDEGTETEGRGVRLIDINEDALKSGEPLKALTTYSIYYSDYFEGSVEKYPGKDKSRDEHGLVEWFQIELSYIVKTLQKRNFMVY